MEYKKHYSVMEKDILEYFSTFDTDEELLFADLTLGAAGHTCSILEKFPNSKLIAFDQDPDAVKNANDKVPEELKKRLTICPTNFSNFAEVNETKNKKFNGILMDLGVSSHHFDSPERGFSFRFEGPLDMRMNPNSDDPTAAELLAELDDDSLLEILYTYGEERFSKQILENIRAHQLKEGPVTQTKHLENIVFHAYPKKLRFGRTHPATKTFQALRIAVNKELDVIEKTLPDLYSYLAPGGMIAVISFHSLEDRVVKHQFKKAVVDDNTLRILTKKPRIPSNEEIEENSRSRSAKLRVIEKRG